MCDADHYNSEASLTVLGKQFFFVPKKYFKQLTLVQSLQLYMDVMFHEKIAELHMNK